jgi:hypothetical protein
LLDKATKIMLTDTYKKAPAVSETKEENDEARPEVMKIMEDVFLSSSTWILSSPGRAVRQGITHLVIPAYFATQALRDQFIVFEV